MTTSRILVQIHDAVATLTLNDPVRMNTLTTGLMQEALAALERIRKDVRVRVLVVRATGRSFCAGARLTDFPAPGGVDANGRSAPEVVNHLMGDLGNPLVLALHNFPVPVLTVVHAVAAGGGVGIALSGDIVIASRSAYFSLPFVPSLALLPDMGVSWVMQRTIGTARTTALSLLGDRLSAETAAQWGLIWACVDDTCLDNLANETAARLAALPASGIAEIRATVRGGSHRSLPDQLEYERTRQVALMANSDFAVGLTAFAAKRPPCFGPRDTTTTAQHERSRSLRTAMEKS
ncbi:enoyl-CoA hydratase-related protein [Cupriavidus lacunae]|uniref:Enoyl-CoA hydratase n=1 Tax=Cupriavidus lacunae TaxID=2666307 RepID=A0A370NJS2_9BURK|nr:enoyl-CoA hydratase-related protein [Cupriavidus lacunae]RDK05853.1 enoyl-CoA hydratase [Cupriavidus lacunae]